MTHSRLPAARHGADEISRFLRLLVWLCTATQDQRVRAKTAHSTRVSDGRVVRRGRWLNIVIVLLSFVAFASGSCLPTQYYPPLCLDCPAAYYCDGNQYHPCPDGRYSRGAASACAACACAPGSYCGGSPASDPVVQCSICPNAGEFCVNSTLKACPAGRYSATLGATSCIACNCPPGSFCDSTSGVCSVCFPGSYCVGSVSLRCPSGFYSNFSGATACTAATCAPGTFLESISTTTCLDCCGNCYCPGGSSNFQFCQLFQGINYDYYGAAPYTTCISCGCSSTTMCNGVAGCVPVWAGYSFIGRNLEVCGPGNYALAGAAVCSPCGCAAGSYCPSNTASTCSPCNSGFWCQNSAPQMCPFGTYSGVGASICSLCTTPPGYYCQNDGRSQPCQMGYFCVGGSAYQSPCACSSGAYCLPLSVDGACVICPTQSYCLGGTHQPTACSSPVGFYCPPGSINATGIPCPAGSFCTGGAAAAQSCPAGTFNSGTQASSATACRACAAGKANPSSGQSSCQPCLPGTYSLTAGLPVCTACNAGTYQPLTGLSSASCIPCSQGSVNVASGQALCQLCSPGRFNNRTGASDPNDCTLCPPGTANANIGQTDIAACVPCVAGAYSSTFGAYSCSPCRAGTFSAVPGQTSSTACQSCPVGAYCGIATAVPSLCSTGRYNAVPGASQYSQCLPCPGGTYNPSSGQTSSSACIVCPASTECPPGSSFPISACAVGSFINATGVCSPCPLGSYCTSHSAMVCPAGYYCLPFSTAPSPCPAGSFSAITGATSSATCTPCLKLGTFATVGSSGCFDCPAGTMSSQSQAPFCVPCAPGFRSTGKANTICSQCSPTDICPLGSAEPMAASFSAPAYLAGQESVPPAIENPMNAVINSGATRAFNAQLGVGLGAFALIIVSSVAYFFFRRQRQVKRILRDLDLLYDVNHHVSVGAALTRNPRSLGGFCTVVAFAGMVTLFVVAIIQYTLAPSYIQSVSPNAPPFQPFGLFNFSVRLLGAPSCTQPSITGPDSAQLVGVSATGFAANADSSLSMFWACPACSLASSSAMTASFTVSSPNCYAAGVEFTVSLPAYTTSATSVGSGSPFTLSGAVYPSPPLTTVFRGSQTPTSVALSLVPVVVHQSNEFVGTFAQLVSTGPGSQVNSSSYSSRNGLSVTMTISPSLLIYEVNVAPQSAILLLAQLGSLLGTVVVVVRVLMNQLERWFPGAVRKSTSAPTGPGVADANGEAGSSPIEMSALDVKVSSRGKSKSQSQSKGAADADGEARRPSRAAGRKKSKASRSAVETDDRASAVADDVVFSPNPLVEASP